MLTLYDNLMSGNGFKVRLILKLTGHDYDYVHIDILKGESRTPDYLAKINPNGRIPALKFDDGRVLAESNAILCYMAEGTRFMPTDPWQKAQMMSWLFFEQYSHEPNIAVLRFWHHVRSDFSEQEKQLMPQKEKAGYAALDIMESQLNHTDWLVGDSMTIADIALFAYTHVADEGGFDLSKYPGINAWIERVKAVDGYAPISEE